MWTSFCAQAWGEEILAHRDFKRVLVHDILLLLGEQSRADLEACTIAKMVASGK